MQAIADTEITHTLAYEFMSSLFSESKLSLLDAKFCRSSDVLTLRNPIHQVQGD
jgi:hypothetical protein